MQNVVAPFVGAWIEIRHTSIAYNCESVAPFVGAWIEILNSYWVVKQGKVAPFVGAWIEIKQCKMCFVYDQGRSLRGSVD